MQNIISYQKKYLTRVAIMAMCVVGLSGVAAAADPVLSQEPLFIQKNLAPNIMLTLDNSASMPLYSVVENSSNPNGEYSSNFSDKGHYSSSVNKIYYDPAITYETAKDYDGTSLGNAAAVGTKFYAWKQIINPYRATSGTGSGERNETSNLVEISKTCFTSGEEPILPLYTMSTMSASTSSCIANSGTTWARYAFYYTLSGDAYTRVDILPTTVKYIRPSSRIDCEAPTTTGCTYEEEMRNFANWVTYYRTRLLTAQTVVSQTFSKLEEGKHEL